ncbi:hypothetical protein ACFLR4_02375 [Bacteroidota bacterium]
MRLFATHIVAALIFIFVFSGITFSQSRKNAEILTDLVDESLTFISQGWSSQNPEVYINYTSQNNFRFFKDRVAAELMNAGTKLITDKDSAELILNYTIYSVNIDYNETFRDGLFSDYLVEREAGLNCSFSLEKNDEVIDAANLVFSNVDTVKYAEIKDLENVLLPFTQAEIPPEPFFSSLLEPVIAIATAVVTLFLFFTVRSK